MSSPVCTPPDKTTLAGYILGESPAIRGLRHLILRAAPLPLPVLIEGPTGAGKELVARALHDASGRSGAFVAFNVCAVADTMWEAALFGHEKGAFTGATSDRRGYLAEADGGTLFLDEISGLSLPNQAKLLRALETREFRPVGGREDRQSDFRVVTATNEDLEELAGIGRFRLDLLHRLQGFALRVPSLAERQEDVPLLAKHFAQGLGPAFAAVELSAGAVRALQQHSWPGNVRELKHAVERAMALANGPRMRREDIEMALGPKHAEFRTDDDFARRRLVTLLEEHGWNTARAAVHLGVHRVTVYRRMRRLGIRVPAAGRWKSGDFATSTLGPSQTRKPALRR